MASLPPGVITLVTRFRTALGAAALVALCATAGMGDANAQSRVTLRATGIFPETDFSSEVLRHWANLVTERTEGRIRFRYYWAGSLVGTKMLDGLRDDVVDVALMFTAYVSGDILDLAVLDIPFSYPLDSAGLVEFHKAVRPAVTAIYGRYGNQVVSATPILLAAIYTCRDRFLAGPDDWKGAIVRTGGRWQAESVKAFGGKPVVISMGELYSALERGTVHCTIMALNGVESLRLYEVAPRITRIDFSGTFGTINVGQAAWSRLSEADRKVMLAAGDETLVWAAEETNKRLSQTIERLHSKGAQFCTPDQAEFARLVSAVDKVVDSNRNQVSPDGAAIIKVVDQYRSRVKSGPTIGPNNPCKK